MIVRIGALEVEVTPALVVLLARAMRAKAEFEAMEARLWALLAGDEDGR